LKILGGYSIPIVENTYRHILQFQQSDHHMDKVMSEMLHKSYDAETGPLWRIAVMKMNDESENLVRNIDEVLQHHYRILFGFHHSITDGYSSTRICGYFLSCLNTVLDDEEFNSYLPNVKFINDDISKGMVESIQNHLKINPTISNSYMENLKDFTSSSPMLFQKFPAEISDNFHTKFAKAIITEETTNNIVSLSKTNGISVHSTFSTIVHMSITSLLKETDCKEELFEFVSTHDINFRRYWKTTNKEWIFGPHMGPHLTKHTLPKNMEENFWLHANRFHKQFNKELDNMDPIIYGEISSELHEPPTTADEFARQQVTSPASYGISNMGDVSKFFQRPDGSEWTTARVTSIQRMTSIPPNVLYSSNFSIQTFNKRLFIGLAYQTRYLKPSTADKLIKNVVHNIQNLK